MELAFGIVEGATLWEILEELTSKNGKLHSQPVRNPNFKFELSIMVNNVDLTATSFILDVTALVIQNYCSPSRCCRRRRSTWTTV